MFFNYLVFNYSSAIILAAGNKANKIISDLTRLNNLFVELKSNYNQHLFNDYNGQNIIINLANDLKVAPIATNLFATLVKNQRLRLLPLICQYLPQLINEQSGIYSAEVKSVSKLRADELDNVSEELTKIFEKKFEVENIVDPAILGGISVRFDSFLIDNSVINRLARVKKYLSEYKLECIR